MTWTELMELATQTAEEEGLKTPNDIDIKSVYTNLKNWTWVTNYPLTEKEAALLIGVLGAARGV